jgi:hypothetical protein
MSQPDVVQEIQSAFDVRTQNSASLTDLTVAPLGLPQGVILLRAESKGFLPAGEIWVSLNNSRLLFFLNINIRNCRNFVSKNTCFIKLFFAMC